MKKQQVGSGNVGDVSRDKGTQSTDRRNIAADSTEDVTRNKHVVRSSREEPVSKNSEKSAANTSVEDRKKPARKSPNEDPGKRKDIGKTAVNKSSDEYFEYKCDPCKTAGDNAEAEGFCADCGEYLCSNCFSSHSRNKASKHHRLLNREDMPKKSNKTCDPCKSAGDVKETVGYCKDCREYMCETCYVSHSRNKLSSHHVLVDNADLAKVSDRPVSSLVSKMNIEGKTETSKLNVKEEYTYICDINVKAHSDGKDCFITGMTLFSDTELIVCDCNNHSLKLVDIDTNIVQDALPLSAEPAGIAVLSKDQVAVVLYNKYQIQIISIKGKRMSVAQTIKTDGNCLDVKFNNGKLYVSYWKPVKFQILQTSGVIVQTIKPEPEVLKHCTVPRHIAVSPDGKVLYVSDWETNKLMTIDMKGRNLHTYQGELEYPHDINLYSPTGVVYLCNRDQHVIYKMTSDLKESTVILVPGDGLSFPQAMCFNSKKRHLYISSGSLHAEYKNFVKVFKWK